MTFAEFKRTLEAGQHVTVSYFSDGALMKTEHRVVSSVTSTKFCTRNEELEQVRAMPYGRSAEWEFDLYIAGFSALWTDPEDPTQQTQYKFVEAGF